MADVARPDAAPGGREPSAARWAQHGSRMAAGDGLEVCAPSAPPAAATNPDRKRSRCTADDHARWQRLYPWRASFAPLGLPHPHSLKDLPPPPHRATSLTTRCATGARSSSLRQAPARLYRWYDPARCSANAWPSSALRSASLATSSGTAPTRSAAIPSTAPGMPPAATRWRRPCRRRTSPSTCSACSARPPLHLPRPRHRPEGATLRESNLNVRRVGEVFARKMERLASACWGHANLFSNRRYMARRRDQP